MYTVIICVIIGFAIGAYREYKEWGEFDWHILIIGFLTGILGGGAGGVVATALPATYKTDKWSEELVALRDNPSTKGSFFLGTGNINGSMKYVYYCKNNDSTYRMWQADYYQATVKYSDRAAPQIHITYTHVDQESIWNRFAFDLTPEEEWSCVFEVPMGSIKSNFDLDAQ